MAGKRSKSAKVRVMETLPSLGDVEVGEVLYDSTNGKLALRLITGWVYFTQD